MKTWMRFGFIATSLAGVCAGYLITGAIAQSTARNKDAQADWQRLLQQRLPVYGHRNWVVIADSAYPSQTRPGIETLVTGSDQLTVVRYVLDQLSRYRHLRPIVHLDAELPHVPERNAPGIGVYRELLKEVLDGRAVQSLPHEQIINNLDRAGEKFNVLILKTDLTLPYTSVFLELDCGYWSAEAEQQLRRAMSGRQ
jgi:hypothetical protein